MSRNPDLTLFIHTRNVLEMTIVGLPLQTALDAERQKRALKAKAEAEVQRKEKEAETLNF